MSLREVAGPILLVLAAVLLSPCPHLVEAHTAAGGAPPKTWCPENPPTITSLVAVPGNMTLSYSPPSTTDPLIRTEDLLYAVYHRCGADTEFTLDGSGIQDLTYNLQGLPPSTMCIARVLVHSADCPLPYSTLAAERSFKTTPSECFKSAPKDLTVQSFHLPDVEISWTAPDDSDGWDVKYRVVAVGTTARAMVLEGVLQNRVTLSTLIPGALYMLYVFPYTDLAAECNAPAAFTFYTVVELTHTSAATSTCDAVLLGVCFPVAAAVGGAAMLFLTVLACCASAVACGICIWLARKNAELCRANPARHPSPPYETLGIGVPSLTPPSGTFLFPAATYACSASPKRHAVRPSRPSQNPRRLSSDRNRNGSTDCVYV